MEHPKEWKDPESELLKTKFLLPGDLGNTKETTNPSDPPKLSTVHWKYLFPSDFLSWFADFKAQPSDKVGLFQHTKVDSSQHTGTRARALGVSSGP